MQSSNEWVRRDSGDFDQWRDDDLGAESERRERGESGDPILLNDEQVCLREIRHIEGMLLSGHPDIQGLTLALSDWSEELRLIRAEMGK